MGYFKDVTPESAGISSKGILNFLDRIEENQIELHSFMVIRHGIFCIFQDSLTAKNDRGITSSAAFILYSSCIQNFLESCNFLCCILKDQSCIACVCNTVTVYICCRRCICIQFCQFCTCCQKCGTVGCCHCTIVVYVT